MVLAEMLSAPPSEIHELLDFHKITDLPGRRAEIDPAAELNPQPPARVIDFSAAGPIASGAGPSEAGPVAGNQAAVKVEPAAAGPSASAADPSTSAAGPSNAGPQPQPPPQEPQQHDQLQPAAAAAAGAGGDVDCGDDREDEAFEDAHEYHEHDHSDRDRDPVEVHVHRHVDVRVEGGAGRDVDAADRIVGENERLARLMREGMAMGGGLGQSIHEAAKSFMIHKCTVVKNEEMNLSAIYVENGRYNLDDVEVALKNCGLFHRLLVDLSEALEVDSAAKPGSINVFLENTSRIAFNKGNTLFFNIHYFNRMGHAAPSIEAQRKAAYFWYITFCHELAHNVASGHDKDHEFAMETIMWSFTDRERNRAGLQRANYDLDAAIDILMNPAC
eukprot:tig00000405_g473.t1